VSIKNGRIYPDCPTISRTVEMGGYTKSQLIQKMQQHAIFMNEFAEMLFANDRFTVADKKYTLTTIELTVSNLGFSEGATTIQIFYRAKQLGLELCPLEVGPYLRIQYLDQPEGYLGKSQQNQAPYGSITIASEILNEDINFPKGFYLRRIKGELWIRGYVADEQHVWGPNDHFVFCLPKNL
jgi:hypothetical protein